MTVLCSWSSHFTRTTPANCQNKANNKILSLQAEVSIRWIGSLPVGQAIQLQLRVMKTGVSLGLKTHLAVHIKRILNYYNLKCHNDAVRQSRISEQKTPISVAS